MPTEPSPAPPSSTVQPDGAPEIRDAGIAGARTFARVSDKIPPGEPPAKTRRKAAPKAKAGKKA